MDWALLAIAIVLLLGAAAVVILRRRSPVSDGTAAGAAGVAGVAGAGTGFERRRSRSATMPLLLWRPRLSRLAALVGRLTALPVLSYHRTNSAAAEDENEVATPPATPPPAPAPIAVRGLNPIKATEPPEATAPPTPAGASRTDIETQPRHLRLPQRSRSGATSPALSARIALPTRWATPRPRFTWAACTRRAAT